MKTSVQTSAQNSTTSQEINRSAQFWQPPQELPKREPKTEAERVEWDDSWEGGYIVLELPGLFCGLCLYEDILPFLLKVFSAWELEIRTQVIPKIEDPSKRIGLCEILVIAHSMRGREFSLKGIEKLSFMQIPGLLGTCSRETELWIQDICGVVLESVDILAGLVGLVDENRPVDSANLATALALVEYASAREGYGTELDETPVGQKSSLLKLAWKMHEKACLHLLNPKP